MYLPDPYLLRMPLRIPMNKSIQLSDIPLSLVNTCKASEEVPSQKSDSTTSSVASL
jgi:hypothetical protein